MSFDDDDDETVCRIEPEQEIKQDEAPLTVQQVSDNNESTHDETNDRYVLLEEMFAFVSVA